MDVVPFLFDEIYFRHKNFNKLDKNISKIFEEILNNFILKIDYFIKYIYKCHKFKTFTKILINDNVKINLPDKLLEEHS